MFEISAVGKTLIVFGIVLTVIGIVFTLGAKLSWFGRLPGDIYIQKKNFSFFFPLTTSIIVSVILTLVALLIRKR